MASHSSGAGALVRNFGSRFPTFAVYVLQRRAKDQNLRRKVQQSSFRKRFATASKAAGLGEAMHLGGEKELGAWDGFGTQ